MVVVVDNRGKYAKEKGMEKEGKDKWERQMEQQEEEDEEEEKEEEEEEKEKEKEKEEEEGVVVKETSRKEFGQQMRSLANCPRTCL